MIKPLTTFDNFNKLKQECLDLISRVPFRDNVNQLGLQVQDPTISDWYSSCGSISKGGGKYIFEESYKHINPELAGTAINEWITSLGVEVYRTRLLLIPGRQCYSIHKDPNPRIHLPVITNSQCLMCFPEQGQMEYMPATGQSYWVDTTLKHTFINCSSEDRIHLVAVTKLRIDSV